MRLKWLLNNFICKELYAPFVLDKDCEYFENLRQKYDLVLEQAKKAGADDMSLKIIGKFRKKY